MERSLKRARVSPKTGGSHGVHRYINNGPLSKDSSDFPQPGLKSRSFSKPHSLSLFSENIGRSTKAISPGHRKLSDLHPRNLIPTKVKGAAEAVQSPSSTVVASVIQVVVNNPAGDLVTQALVPVASKIVSVQGFAPITLGKGPATASAIPSAASKSKQASHHQQPSPTDATGQDSYGPRTTAAGTRRPLQSQSPERSASANPSHLSINVPGSKSQVLLSSPPSTPLPSTPASTLSSSPSTDSYFSTSAPTATSATNSALNADPATQTSNAHNMPAPPKSNSTLTTTSPSRSKTGTTTRPTVLSPAFSTFNTNSTLATSTRSPPSFASSGSLTSSTLSSHNVTSLSTFSTGTPSSSRTAFSSTSASTTQSLSTASSTSSTATGGAVGGAGGSGNTGSPPSSIPSSGAGSGGNSVDTRAVVGGVVGGVAGLAVILLLLIFLLRWRRSKRQRRDLSPAIPPSAPPGITSTAPTTERSSIVPFAASAFMRRMRPGSGQTAASGETAPSERGFQNLGGRKLESVLSSRGDGYNDPVPPGGVAPRGYAGTAAGLGLAAGLARRPGQGPSPGPSDPETLSGSSFYRDSHGFYGGHEGDTGLSSPPPTSPISPADSPPGEGIEYYRPGPARTPIINEPGVTRIPPTSGTGHGTPPPIGRGTPPPTIARGTPPPRNLTPQLRQQDEVGRSHPSFDGSRGSRFSEAV